MKNTFSISILAVASISIGLYPLAYFMLEQRFGLLTTKTTEILTDPFWKTAFYLHIVFGGLALLSGWPQFVKSWRNSFPALHRTLGTLYVGFVFLSGFGALYASFFASTGKIAALGFFSLGVIWLGSTANAFASIRRRDFLQHEKWMIVSFACTLAAVMLRIWLPTLLFVTGDFNIAYPITAWLCWVPNILVAFLITKRITAPVD